MNSSVSNNTKMKTTLTILRLLLVLVVIVSINGPPRQVSAHFYPNLTSIPTSLSPNASIWAAFNKLAGCQKGVKTQGLANLKKYFQLFGYINATYANFSDDFDDHLDAAVKAYQLNFNLNATGEIDAPTLSHLVLPRCGNPDVVNGTSTMRRRGANSASAIHAVEHYSFFPGRPRWPLRTTRLTYAFLPGNELSAAVRAVFARAFERWAEVTPLTFAEAAGYDGANIRIGFYGGDHGDGEPFDGVLGTLAHAFSPPVGRLHLDSAESWLVDGGFMESAGMLAVDLELVAVHEIGHLLGLGHSSVEESIMYPTISTGTRKVELANDDVMGVQELYGSNPNYTGPVLTPRDERDTSGGAPRVLCRGALLLVGGLFSLLLL